MGQRRRSREVALQILYCMDMTDSPADEAISYHYEFMTTDEEKESQATVLIRPFTERLVHGVHLHRHEIDQTLLSASEHWRLDRMSIVDRNILRIALFEMLYCPDVPPKVSINEAIDIGKKFGTEDSGSFINGVLDNILGNLQKAEQALESSDLSSDRRTAPDAIETRPIAGGVVLPTRSTRIHIRNQKTISETRWSRFPLLRPAPP